MIFIVYVGYNPSFSHDSNGGVIKQPLKLGYVWVITVYNFVEFDFYPSHRINLGLVKLYQ